MKRSCWGGRGGGGWMVAGGAIAAAIGCSPVSDPSAGAQVDDPIGEQSQAIVGANLAGTNLAGTNLGGSNLAGTNLGGVNLGGSNLGGSNLGGSNLAGTNLGGSNLGGSNLGGSNLAGTNLAGTNLGGSNLGGSNLAGTNLGGSNLGGSNLGGSNLAGTNLGGSNLAGTNTGFNIHGLAGSINGMLYSGEDMWSKGSGNCVVSGIGSVAFARLINAQSANAKISVALGKLPWGYSSGSSINLNAWEAVVWGDKTYCSFVLASPTGTSWSGVAGFIKALFRWNAPPSQSMDISGIEASSPYDPTLNTSVLTYTGMMNAAGQYQAGKLADATFVAGELAFVTATTNNQAVNVDFSSWIQDTNKNPLILGNVDPTYKYAESVYVALDNGDGTVSIMVDDSTSIGWNNASGITRAYADLTSKYSTWNGNKSAQPKPVPRRCGGALDLSFNNANGEAVPLGKCDDGLVWGNDAANTACATGSQSWSTVVGAGAPAQNGYMQLTKPGGTYKRAPYGTSGCGTMKPVLSETYIHMATAGYDFNRAYAGTVNATGTPCNATAQTPASAFDNLLSPATGTKWCVTSVPSTSAPNAIMYTFPTGYYYAVNSYSVTSANDLPGRDPRDWTLQGCNGSCNVGVDAGWTTIDTRVGQVFLNRWQTNTYSFANSTYFTQVRLRVTDNASSGQYTQLGELQLFDSNGCTPQTDAAFCASYGKNCGSFTASDNCGSARTVANCGACTSPQTCSGGGVANVCGSGGTAMCTAAYAQSTCSSYVQGAQVSSGGHNWTCTNGNCSQCQLYSSCAPGGSSCAWGTVWQDNGPCQTGGSCTHESDSQFCSRLAKNCGQVSGTDNCGTSRTVTSCGTCTSPLSCGGAGTANVCGASTSLVSTGGTVSAVDPGASPEDMSKAWDNNITTKWFVFSAAQPWTAYQFAGGAKKVVTSYAVTSGNDAADRDPLTWQLLGSNDNVTWTVVDTQNYQTFSSRMMTRTYSVTNSTSYNRYKFQVLQKNGSVDFQVGGIELYGY